MVMTPKFLLPVLWSALLVPHFPLWGLEPEASDFVPIFDGCSFAGWQGDVENYAIVDGAIQCIEGKGGTIFTEKSYCDFTVQFEFRLPAGGNNGLAIRYPGEGDPAYSGMCELQVLDNSAQKYADLDPRQYHGSAYGMVAAERGHLRPVGEWNQQTVTVVGSKISVILNGVEILNGDLDGVRAFMADKGHPGKDRKCGYFGFAGHKDPVAFRNIRIFEINKGMEQ